MSLCACTGGGGSGEASLDPLTKDDVIQLTVLSHASWPYNEDWVIWDYIEEGTGATLDVTSIPSSDFATKLPIMFASQETLPDILAFGGKRTSDEYAAMGALIAYDDMAEYMPNYNAWLNSLSEEVYSSNVSPRKAADGKIYYSPVQGRERSINLRTWLYREDIFKKHNLRVPETFDEVYDVSKQLKALYPESYPFAVRSGYTAMSVTGSSWKEYWEFDFYYDYNTGKWSYGPSEDIMLDIIMFYKKMVDEKLMPADFLTLNTQSWQELITTDKGFIMPEYQTRIDFFNGLARANNPEFNLAAMVPPVANAETGAAMVGKYNDDPYGSVMCNSGDDARIANAAKYMDWFYSDEAKELVGWGKEGETYEVVDGKKVFITDETNSQPNTLYGLITNGTFALVSSEAVEAMESADIAATRDVVLEHTMPRSNPLTWVALNDEEQKVVDAKATAINQYRKEMVSKFILGQEPLSKFDEFVDTINEMGIDEVLKVYESAYNRVK